MKAPRYCAVAIMMFMLLSSFAVTHHAAHAAPGWAANFSVPGANGAIRAIVQTPDAIYVGGDFTTIGTVAANRVARYDKASGTWSALGSGMNGNVYSLAVSGSDLYAGGFLITAGGVEVNRIARWNGTTWSALGNGMNGNVYALAVSGSDLYAGGDFTTAGGVEVNRIARWNGTTWSALGNGTDDAVNVLTVSGSNLYVGGSFTSAGGVAATSRIAKWDGTTWSALGSGMGGNVLALAVSGGDLYAGGSFITAGGVSANRIAKWDGANWSALSSGMDNHVQALAVSGSDLYAGGFFTTAGGISANRIAKWDGTNWSALGSGMDSAVYVLAVSGNDLYAGGNFTTAGGKVSAFIARYGPLSAILSIDDVAVREGNSGTTTLTFTVTRSGDLSGTSTVHYSTSNGSALAGSDYTALGDTTLTFAPTETTKTINVSVNGDTIFELNENFNVTLSNAVGATISDGTGLGTITNDDSIGARGGKITFESGRDGNSEIYVMNADGTNQTRLTNNSTGDSGPSLSPDGSKIAFTSGRDGHPEIYVMNADGTNQTRLTFVASDLPVFSPDGTRITFTSDRDGNREIYVMNADGTNQTRLTNNSTHDYYPAFSPDGSKIVFEATRDDNAEIYVMNADGTGQTRLTDRGGEDIDPAFSPDGSKIVFYSSRDGNGEIYVMDANGANQTRLTNHHAIDYAPNFSPDGSKIVFHSNRDGNTEIYTMNADGSSPARLTSSVAHDEAPSWAPGEVVLEAPSLIVTTTADMVTVLDQKTSLREAMTYANSHAGADTITFNIPTSDSGYSGGVWTIAPASALPTLIGANGANTTIDGYTQPGATPNTLTIGSNAVLKIELNGVTQSFNGLTLSADDCTVRGLVINRFTDGIYMGGATNSVISGNYIGTNAAGTAKLANSFDGVGLAAIASNNTIGGTTPAARNLISGNGRDGVCLVNEIATGNTVVGNYIGTDVTGAAALGNTGNGVTFAYADNNTIGGTTVEARNIISGNGGDGVYLVHGATSNMVQGNYIGTNAAGTAKLANSFDGVGLAYDASNNTIGGTAAGARNVISGNGSHGIYLVGEGIAGNTVVGNYIGTDMTGTAALGNTNDGVRLAYGSNNTIGGTTAEARNIISGNGGMGVQVNSGATGNKVSGNYIGIDVIGNTALPNAYGVVIDGATNTTVGGATAGERNVISGNINTGVYIQYIGLGNKVSGNYIGTTADGSTTLSNSIGVDIIGANSTTVGGATTDERNVISGNSSYGVYIRPFWSTLATGNKVSGNYIGIDVTGNTALANGHGVYIDSCPSNTIGGTSAAERNVISGNTNTGVTIFGSTATGNSIKGNAIYANGALGIDLGGAGVTVNDTGDGDTGPNSLQNYPVITGVTKSGGTTTITGTLHSTANSSFTLDFYRSPNPDPSGYGEGQTHLTNPTAGSTSVTTNGSGNASFSVSFSEASSDFFFTATATNAAGSTSEFSQSRSVGGLAANDSPLVVNSTADAITLNFSDNVKTLREAISYANALGTSSGAPATIAFNIGATDPNGVANSFSNGAAVITPAAALPTIANSYINVDGATQTTFGNNANAAGPDVAIMGGSAGTSATGLKITGGNCTVKGLLVSGFGGDGIQINGANNTVSGCYIGVATLGTARANNNGNGGTASIYVTGSGATGNVIGGTTIADRNLITGARDGIKVDTGASARIIGNFIGADKNGNALGCGASGIVLNSPGTVVGIAANGEPAGNTIAYNVNHGILVQSSANKCQLRYNSIFNHGRLGINLSGGTEITSPANYTANNNVTQNDTVATGTTVATADSDGSSSANGLQNYPVLSSAIAGASGTLKITGRLESIPNRVFDMDFYRNTTADPNVAGTSAGAGAYGEGQTYIGSIRATTLGSASAASGVSTAAAGTAPSGTTITATATSGNFVVTFTNPPAGGNVITATATYSLTNSSGTAGANLGDTSEFSQAKTVVNNGAPVANNQSVETNEDTPIATTLSASDVDNDALTYSVTLPAHGTLSGAAPALTYTPETNYNGPDSFTFKVNDGLEDSNPATVSLTVASVNDDPVISLPGAALDYAENDGVQVLDSAATVGDVDSANFENGTLNVAFSANGAAEDRLAIRHQGAAAGQIGVNGSTITYGGTAIGTFSGGTAGSTPLVVVFNAAATPAAGQALLRNVTYQNVSEQPSTAARTVQVVLTDGDGGSSHAATKTINVTSVNDDPTISDIAHQTTPQDTTTGAISFTVGDAETAVSDLTLSKQSSNSTLVPTANIVFGGSGANRTVTITPAANQSGTAVITITVTDANSGTASDSFVLTVPDVNDAPVLNPNATLSLSAINEDATSNGGTLVSALIGSAITDANGGDPQGIAVTAVNNSNGTWQFSLNNGALWTDFTPVSVTTARLLAADGQTKVRLVPSADFFGSVNPGLTLRAWDQSIGTNGGTADTTGNGGTTAFSSATNTARITVNAVNDAPSFTKGEDQIVPVNAPAQTVLRWATGMRIGPNNEVGQTLSFIVSNTDNALFSQRPAVAPDGTLTYTPAPGATGTATVTVVVQDSGSNTAPSDNNSDGQSFTITVEALDNVCAADVTGQVEITRYGYVLNRRTGRYTQKVTLKSSSNIAGPVSLVLSGLSPGDVSLFNRTGTTSAICQSEAGIAVGTPYINVPLGGTNQLTEGVTAVVVLEFTNPSNARITYTPRVLAGNGDR